jgi:hypothetical protein
MKKISVSLGTILLVNTFISPVFADEYQSWMGEFNPDVHCTIYEEHSPQQSTYYNNQATVDEVQITSEQYNQQSIYGVNQGESYQSVDLIRQRDCSAVLQIEAQRYGVYQQYQHERYLFDTQMRQNLLGNVLQW